LFHNLFGIKINYSKKFITTACHIFFVIKINYDKKFMTKPQFPNTLNGIIPASICFGWQSAIFGVGPALYGFCDKIRVFDLAPKRLAR